MSAAFFTSSNLQIEPRLGSRCRGTVPVGRQQFILFQLFSNNGKPRQDGSAKARRNGNIGSISPAGNDDAADPRMVMPCVKCEPPTADEDLKPSAEVHWGGIARNSDITEVTRAVSCRDVQTSAQRNRKMCEVATHTDALFVSFGGSPIIAGMMIAKLDTVMHIIANCLNPAPAAPGWSKHRPS